MKRLLLLVLAFAALAAAAAQSASAAGSVRILVLSNRADLISGGDALVAIQVPAGASAGDLRITLGSRNITRSFARRANGRFEALVSGLRLGRNVLTARLPDGRGARITITNHPNGGPVFSGPQVKPWICQKTAVDAKCDQPAKFDWLYKSTNSRKSGLWPYNPAHPPSDVAMTTTDAGARVPFIVRREIGYQDRDRYRIETLWQRGKPWQPWAPQAQWDHKLLLTHGFSCHTSYRPEDPPWGGGGIAGAGFPDISEVALARGYTVGSATLANSNNDCNVALQAESIMMLKEHITEHYGELRYTIGEGCSGGSLAISWMSNAYPGLYQGLIPTCTFPDADSTAQQIFDYALLSYYFGIPINGKSAGPIVGPVPLGTMVAELLASKGWTTAQAAAVAGDATLNLPVSANWAFSAYNYFQLADPTGCPSYIKSQAYNPQTRPGGVRCGVLDWQINLLGPRPQSVWDAQEQAVGHGFAGIPVDNVGIQYGLAALDSGAITAAQFVDLNSKIGGGNPDLQLSPQRVVADEPALRNAYRTGLIDDASNLDKVAILNLAGPNDPGLAHDSYRAFAIRARLDQEHGTHANQVMWQGPVPIEADAKALSSLALIAMDRWLNAVTDDRSNTPLPTKIIEHKPSDLGDACFDGVGNKLHDGICGDLVVPVYGTPRTVAGEPITTEQNKCQLKPLNRADYPVHFTDAQWATMQQTFPTGVCDYSKPGVDQQRVIPWQTYSDARGRVVYGGRPLGAAPRSVPFG